MFIAQADTKLGEHNELLEPVTCRIGPEILDVDAKRVHYLDISPKQVVSVSAGLIPFLEHDDANRALMGSNMRSEEHTSELQSRQYLVCRLLLEKKTRLLQVVHVRTSRTI